MPCTEITGLPPAATVPDAALAEADEIRFLDNSPESLRKRLGHGNIYPAGQADEALGGLFETASLAELREIGLQVVAETLSPAAPPGRASRWTCWWPSPIRAQADALVRRGIRLARRSSAKCTVLALIPPAGGSPGDVAARVRSAAQDAGAAVIVRAGRDTAATIAQAVRETGARHLVMAVPPTGCSSAGAPAWWST